jgi:hypothetical protein
METLGNLPSKMVNSGEPLFSGIGIVSPLTIIANILLANWVR